MPWEKKRGYAAQGEKAVIIKTLRQKGYQLKYLLKSMPMPKSTYFFELSKVDLVDKRNTQLKNEIQKILQNIKVDMVCAVYIKSFSIEAL